MCHLRGRSDSKCSDGKELVPANSRRQGCWWGNGNSVRQRTLSGVDRGGDFCDKFHSEDELDKTPPVLSGFGGGVGGDDGG